MVPTKKSEANRHNARLSTGPHDTSITRFNATRHGIFSAEVPIPAVDGEDAHQRFEELKQGLTDYWDPIGTQEECLVEMLAILNWRWQRVVLYEAKGIRFEIDRALAEQRAVEERIRAVVPEGYEYIADTDGLIAAEAHLARVVDAADKVDPLLISDEVWQWAVSLMEDRLKLEVPELLGRSGGADDTAAEETSLQHRRALVKQACKLAKIQQKEFWRQVKEWLGEVHTTLADAAERSRELDHRIGQALLPDDLVLAKVLKYEPHIWKLIEKVTHELERMQARQKSGRPLAPLAIDVDVNVEAPQPKGSSMKLADYLHPSG